MASDGAGSVGAVMTPEFSRRMGATLGRAGFVLGVCESFEMENRIRDWLQANASTASWETMPREFREYIGLVESQ